MEALYEDDVPAKLQQLKRDHRRMLAEQLVNPAHELRLRSHRRGVRLLRDHRLKAQRDHSKAHCQNQRQELYERLLTGVDGAVAESSCVPLRSYPQCPLSPADHSMPFILAGSPEPAVRR